MYEDSPTLDQLMGGALSESILRRADSLAKTSATPESELASRKETEAVCGVNIGELLASYDHDSRSWRTSQRCLGGDFGEFSGILPRSGMTVNGTLLELTIWGRVRIENESGYWHTPTTRDWKGQSGRGNRIRRGKNGRLHIANLCDQIVDFGRQDLVRSTTFREWLMGLPIGWTVVNPSETPSSHKLQSGSAEEL